MDEELNSTPGRKWFRWPRTTTRPVGWVCLFLGIISVAVYGFGTNWWSRAYFTCSRCRAVQTHYSVVSATFNSIEDNDFSTWFASHKPIHTHHWCWIGWVDMQWHFGSAQGCGDEHRIWRLDPDMQRQFLESASNEEVRMFYEKMDSSDPDVQQKGVDLAKHVIAMRK